MAAALFNRHAQGRAWADSAGTRPAARDDIDGGIGLLLGNLDV
jgi:hypothetical protein